jgi:hypothetical protein
VGAVTTLFFLCSLCTVFETNSVGFGCVVDTALLREHHRSSSTVVVEPLWALTKVCILERAEADVQELLRQNESSYHS